MFCCDISILDACAINASFHVNVGDEFNYKINQASILVTIGNNSISSSGLNILGHRIDEGCNLKVEVTAKGFSSLSFAYIIGEYRQIGVIYEGIIDMILRPATTYALLVLDWLTTDWDKNIVFFNNGYRIMNLQSFIPIINVNEENWNYIQEFKTTFEQAIISMNDFSYYQISQFVDDKKGILLGEWQFDFIYLDYTPNYFVNFSGTSHYSTAFRKSNGVCLGMRYSGDCVGHINGTIINISMEQFFESEDYDMPEFNINNTVNASSFTMLSVLVATSLLAITLKREKLKKIR